MFYHPDDNTLQYIGTYLNQKIGVLSVLDMTLVFPHSLLPNMFAIIIYMRTIFKMKNIMPPFGPKLNALLINFAYVSNLVHIK